MTSSTPAATLASASFVESIPLTAIMLSQTAIQQLRRARFNPAKLAKSAKKKTRK